MLSTNKRFFSLLYSSFLLSIVLLAAPSITKAQADFNPNFIISDQEMQDYQTWNRTNVQDFLVAKGSFLSQYQTTDVNGVTKSAADIIFEAAQNYQVNPKFILVTLQKEQSLITDDTPTQKQLDWATGYAVCDSCSKTDPAVAKHKGFGKQVDDAAGVIRWYYDHKDQTNRTFQKDKPVSVDNLQVIPQSWATAFLYTYTPHLHGNMNFARIWQTWFEQVYPDGSLLASDSTHDVYLVQNGQRRKFKNRTALISRADPNLVVTISDVDLGNYPLGPDINFSNYSILRTPSQTYLVDYDTIRPFASQEVVRELGYNPEEIIDVTDSDLSGYTVGSTITASTTQPIGAIFHITDLKNTYYLYKDSVLHPILDKKIIDANYKNLPVEKHTSRELGQYQVADLPVTFADGTLLQTKDSNQTFVMEKGKKRLIADDDTFLALGYKRSNVVTVDLLTTLNIPNGDPLFLNTSLLSAKNKYLGDAETEVVDLYKSKVPAYVIAEYPSGRIISGKNIDTRYSIASLTKITNAYEALQQNFKLDGTTSYSSSKYAIDKNTLNLKDGEKIKNSDLINTMLIGSINNVARMVVGATGLSETDFVNKITSRLADWGADNTTITDVTGLDEGNKSTPRDLLKIFTKALENDTLKKIMGKDGYTFTSLLGGKKVSHGVKNTNQLFFVKNKNYTILDSKTGYTDEAGGVMMMLVQTGKAASTPATLTATLKKGSSGAEVKLLQQMLQKAGYLAKTVTANGNFGDATEKAVIKFQKASSLTAEGLVGPATRAALNATVTKPSTGVHQYIIITLNNTDYAHRFDEPGKMAEWLAQGNFTIATK